MPYAKTETFDYPITSQADADALKAISASGKYRGKDIKSVKVGALYDDVPYAEITVFTGEWDEPTRGHYPS